MAILIDQLNYSLCDWCLVTSIVFLASTKFKLNFKMRIIILYRSIIFYHWWRVTRDWGQYFNVIVHELIFRFSAPSFKSALLITISGFLSVIAKQYVEPRKQNLTAEQKQKKVETLEALCLV